MSTHQPGDAGGGRAETHVRVAVPRDADDEGVRARLWAAEPLGLWETPDEVVAYFDEEPGGDLPEGATVERVADEDWQALWRAGLEPVVAGPFRVVPSWLAGDETGAGDTTTTIVLDPGEAFGSGHHATTAMCLELLGDAAEQGRLAGARVADVGSGSGLLSIAAALAGAAEVVACDVDPAAVAATARNADANGVTVHAVQGSTDTVLHRGPYDVVMANLLTDTITALAARLGELVASDGLVVVSGISVERAEAPLRALTDGGLDLVERLERNGWVAAALQS